MTKLLTHINTPQKVTSLKYNNDPKRSSRHYYDFLNLLQQLTSMTSLKVARNRFMAHADWVLIVRGPITHESLQRNVNNMTPVVYFHPYFDYCFKSFFITFFNLSSEDFLFLGCLLTSALCLGHFHSQ